MNKAALFLVLLLPPCLSYSQYWQQRADYSIKVTLNDKEKTLDAFEEIVYTNHSPDTLAYIWFHLWPNAYKTDKTAFSDQLLENGSTNFYFSSKEQKGYINHLNFKVDGITTTFEDHPHYIDIIKLKLPALLLPGKKIIITTPFHEKLPYNFSRGGYDSLTFQVTQWYPKPAVYDQKGWHEMPYLDQGEFYSEFGSFKVQITLPADYVVAATGALQTAQEIEWLKTIKKKQIINKPSKKIADNRKPPSTLGKKPVPGSPQPAIYKTLLYEQDSIHDFAWFANKNFIPVTDTCLLYDKRIITVNSYYTKAHKEIWQNSIQFAKDAIRFYSSEVGTYPYDVVSVVEGPKSFGGGMEYPTITIISPMESEKELDQTIAHEIGHNWFYGVIATNERDHPWMDEGINSFYEYMYIESRYGNNNDNNRKEIIFQTVAKRKNDQQIETKSEDFNVPNYDLVAYHKTAKWMQLIEEKEGRDSFKSNMHHYFETWSFRHPYPDDFKNSFTLPAAIKDSLFNLLNNKGVLPNEIPTGFSLVTPIPAIIESYLQHPSKNILFVSPVFAANEYDKLLLGIAVTNLKLPPSSFQYLLVPMYGTGSKKFAGLGKFGYSIISTSFIHKTDLFINASSFSMDQVTDQEGHLKTMQFKKLVPGLRLTFKENNTRSTIHKYIQWKTYFINEQTLKTTQDTLIAGSDTSFNLRYHFPRQSRYLNQLQFVYENYRALYPFQLKLEAEEAKDFVRTSATLNYYFNYNSTDGLQVRLFGGKFFYIGEKTDQKQFDNDRYFLNLTGANGYEDYTYSDYFIGRNSFDELTSQQIMIRDGGFKVRSDLLLSKIGKTDNWLTAINFNSSIPSKLNPLSVLPFKIPLHLFLDIGTYAEAWNNSNANGKILYDMGFHIPLLRETINIYIPILYSSAYRDYFKSYLGNNRFLKEISFSIDLYNKDLKKINRIIEF